MNHLLRNKDYDGANRAALRAGYALPYFMLNVPLLAGIFSLMARARSRSGSISFSLIKSRVNSKTWMGVYFSVAYYKSYSVSRSKPLRSIHPELEEGRPGGFCGSGSWSRTHFRKGSISRARDRL